MQYLEALGMQAILPTEKTFDPRCAERHLTDTTQLPRVMETVRALHDVADQEAVVAFQAAMHPHQDQLATLRVMPCLFGSRLFGGYDNESYLDIVWAIVGKTPRKPGEEASLHPIRTAITNALRDEKGLYVEGYSCDMTKLAQQVEVLEKAFQSRTPYAELPMYWYTQTVYAPSIFYASKPIGDMQSLSNQYQESIHGMEALLNSESGIYRALIGEAIETRIMGPSRMRRGEKLLQKKQQQS